MDNFDQNQKQVNEYKRVLDRYEENEFIQALIESFISLVPVIGTFSDKYLVNKWSSYKKERLITLLDEVEKGEKKLSEGIIQSEEFLQLFFKTVEASVRTKQREKIRFLGRFLTNTVQENDWELSFGLYEDLLDLLNELTYRELKVLALLDKYQPEIPIETSELGEASVMNDYWPKFKKDSKEKFGQSWYEIRTVLFRLQRTGCYVPIEAWDTEPERGFLTTTWEKLRNLGKIEVGIF